MRFSHGSSKQVERRNSTRSHLHAQARARRRHDVQLGLRLELRGEVRDESRVQIAPAQRTVVPVRQHLPLLRGGGGALVRGREEG